MVCDSRAVTMKASKTARVQVCKNPNVSFELVESKTTLDMVQLFWQRLTEMGVYSRESSTGWMDLTLTLQGMRIHLDLTRLWLKLQGLCGCKTEAYSKPLISAIMSVRITGTTEKFFSATTRGWCCFKLTLLYMQVKLSLHDQTALNKPVKLSGQAWSDDDL